jgi:site-specific recombinase XerD
MLKAVKLYAEESPRKERNIALIEVLASSGCRISEVINLNVQDIDRVNRTAIVTGKGSKQRRAWFSQSAMDALETYWKERGSTMATDPVFLRHDKGTGSKVQRMSPTTARNVVKQIAMVAGIDPNKFSPHYFRHAFAIRVLSETHDLALTQDLLGHADPAATRVYAKIYSEDMQRAHRDIFK